MLKLISDFKSSSLSIIFLSKKGARGISLREKLANLFYI